MSPERAARCRCRPGGYTSALSSSRGMRHPIRARPLARDTQTIRARTRNAARGSRVLVRLTRLEGQALGRAPVRRQSSRATHRVSPARRSASGPGAPRDQRRRNTNTRRSRASRDAARRAAGHEGKWPTRLADARRRGKGTRGAAPRRSRAGRAGAADAVDRRLRPAAGCRPGRAPCQQRRRNTGERRRHAAGQTPPDSLGYRFLYEPPDGKHDTIGSWTPPRLDPSANTFVRIVPTDDPAEAEHWRVELAAGRFPIDIDNER